MGIVGDDGVLYPLNEPFDEYISAISVFDRVCVNEWDSFRKEYGHPPFFVVCICQLKSGEATVEEGRGIAGGEMGFLK